MYLETSPHALRAGERADGAAAAAAIGRVVRKYNCPANVNVLRENPTVQPQSTPGNLVTPARKTTFRLSPPVAGKQHRAR